MSSLLTHKYLTALADENGLVTVSNADLAHRASKTEGAVGQHLDLLERQGVIRRSDKSRNRIIEVLQPAKNIPDWVRTDCIQEPITRARRACLHCGNDFDSEWIGNRLCPACKDSAPFQGGSFAA